MDKIEFLVILYLVCFSCFLLGILFQFGEILVYFGEFSELTKKILIYFFYLLGLVFFSLTVHFKKKFLNYK